jgi:DMSO/TMAO reductase YedYZ molybdopterin-dependent catalytic subunit
MRRIAFIVGVLIWIAFSASVQADSNPDAVSVGGTVDHPGDWTIARLKSDLAADVTSISYTTHGQKHTSNVVPLLSLLKAAGVQTQVKMDPKADPRMKNSELHLIVGVECRDGYLVTFSLGELLADIGNRHVWLAFDMDGQPLPQRDGPIRLIVPEDAKPGRWAHAVQTIFVVNIAAPTTQPAN